MPATTDPRPAVPWLLIGALLSIAVTAQIGRDRLTPPPGVGQTPLLWLQSPELARRLALSFDDLAADVYWIRAVVHYGTERRSTSSTHRYALLYPLLDMTTTLDPSFDVAARMGAIFLSEGYPGGPGRPDQAIALLEKGQRHDPTRWQYAHDIGFVHYWWLKDYTTAARHFERAAAMPGAPNWLRSLAGTTLLEGGDRASARTLWRELYTTAEVDWMRRAAEFRLAQLQALDDIDALAARVAAVAARLGRAPTDWHEVIAAGGLPGIPTDPAGAPYALGPGGTVTLGDGSPLAPLPVLEVRR
ncbi:MAG: tetratricopeptide repeat protein [Vicinamibacterales bacterium]